MFIKINFNLWFSFPYAVGNGDILSYEDYNKRRNETGVSGAMIARYVKKTILTMLYWYNDW